LEGERPHPEAPDALLTPDRRLRVSAEASVRERMRKVTTYEAYHDGKLIGARASWRV
jgi:hypothetical protein